MDFFRALMYVLTCFSMRCLRQLRLQLPGYGEMKQTGFQLRSHSRGCITVNYCKMITRSEQAVWCCICLTCGVSRFDLSFQLQSDACHLFVCGVPSTAPFSFLWGVAFEVDECHQAVATGLPASCGQHGINMIMICMGKKYFLRYILFCVYVAVSCTWIEWLRLTWSKCPSPVLRPAGQLRVQVTFGVFDLERRRLLHWRGQSLYRQTQHSG